MWQGMGFDANRTEVGGVAIAHEVDGDRRAEESLRTVAGEASWRDPELPDRHAVEQRYRFYSYGDCMLVE